MSSGTCHKVGALYAKLWLNYYKGGQSSGQDSTLDSFTICCTFLSLKLGNPAHIIMQQTWKPTLLLCTIFHGYTEHTVLIALLVEEEGGGGGGGDEHLWIIRELSEMTHA